LALKDRIQFLTTPEDVDAFLARHPEAVLFKAGTCHKTQETFARLEPLLTAREDLPLGVVRVVEARPASNRVAEATGIRHESPQVLLLRGGHVAFHRDNWAITAEAFADALQAAPTRT
jgi:bacillithiol system protein YtxJ